MYDQNDTLPAFTIDSSSGSDVVVPMDGNKYMILPTSLDITNVCNDQNFVEFEVDINNKNNKCIRQVILDINTDSISSTQNDAIMETNCEQISSIGRYVTDLLIAA